MVIDLRKQTRTIRIELTQTGFFSDYSIDEYIDDVLKDLEIVLTQRKKPEKFKIEIILE